MKNSKIDKLKDEARGHLIEYRKIQIRFDCGIDLAEHLSPDLIYHKNEFNRIMDELAKIDPLTPKMRL